MKHTCAFCLRYARHEEIIDGKKHWLCRDCTTKLITAAATIGQRRTARRGHAQQQKKAQMSLFGESTHERQA